MIIATDELFIASSNDNLAIKLQKQSFFQNLIKYSQFKEFHIFYQSNFEKQKFLDTYQQFLKDNKKIKLYPIHWLSKICNQVNYTVFFTWDIYISDLIYLRSTVKYKFPISVFANKFHYKDLIKEFLFFNFLPIQKYDFLFFQSKYAKEKFQNLYQKINKYLINKQAVINKKFFSFKNIQFNILDDLLLPLSKKQVRQEFNIKSNQKIILIVEELNPYQSSDLVSLIQEFKEFVKNNPQMILFISGDYQDKNYLEQLNYLIDEYLLSENIKIYPNPDFITLKKLFSVADCFFVPADNIEYSNLFFINCAQIYNLPIIIPKGIIDYPNNKNLFYYPKNISADLSNFSFDRQSINKRNFLLAQNTILDFSFAFKCISDIFIQSTQYIASFDSCIPSWEVIIKNLENQWIKQKELLINTQDISQEEKFNFVINNYGYSTFEFEKQAFKITSKGISFDKENEILIIYEDVQDNLDEEVIYDILQVLQQVKFMKYSELLENSQQKYKISIYIFKFILSWMLKQNLIAFI